MRYEENPSAGSSIIPILVLGGVGYFAYSQGWLSGLMNMFGGSSTSIPITPVDPNVKQAPTQPAYVMPNWTTPNVTVSPGDVSPPSNANEPDSAYVLMSKWINSNLNWFTSNGGVATFDQWNNIKGQVGSDNGHAIEDIFPGQDRNQTMTLQQFIAGYTAKGLAGGLGMILNWQDFFTQQPHKKTRVGNFR